MVNDFEQIKAFFEKSRQPVVKLLMDMEKSDDFEQIKAIIEYYISVAVDGDYVFQALILKDMCPNGW